MTVKAEGLDVDQVAAAKPKLTITAESPLRADSADGSTGSLEASLINTPTGTPPSITTGGFMPSTGDMAMYAAAAAAAPQPRSSWSRSWSSGEVAAIKSSWQPHRERGET